MFDVVCLDGGLCVGAFQLSGRQTTVLLFSRRANDSAAIVDRAALFSDEGFWPAQFTSWDPDGLCGVRHALRHLYPHRFL